MPRSYGVSGCPQGRSYRCTNDADTTRKSMSTSRSGGGFKANVHMFPGWDLYETPPGGEYENVSVLVAMAVNEEGYRKIPEAWEGLN